MRANTAAWKALLPIILLSGAVSGGSSPDPSRITERHLSWRRKPGVLALLNNGHVVWQLNYAREEGKPYFHPLSTIEGEVLTCLRPEDHPWHRALWFSWKKINGVNYWEEDRETGLSAGRTEIVNASVETDEDFSAKAVINLSYHPPDAEEILSERRVITISAPDDDGSYRIDWNSCFKARCGEVRLERTPPTGEQNGKSYGGYAGLSIRTTEWTRNWKFSDSEGRVEEAIHGRQAEWVDFSGKTPAGRDAGIAIFDHPSNIRYPSPWFIIKGMPYFSPAVLFNRAHFMSENEELVLKYRILVYNGAMNRSALDCAYKYFTGADSQARTETEHHAHRQ